MGKALGGHLEMLLAVGVPDKELCLREALAVCPEGNTEGPGTASSEPLLPS